MAKAKLAWYEENASEIVKNKDGSVTFVFDEPGQAETSTTTISEKDYKAAKENPNLEV